MCSYSDKTNLEERMAIFDLVQKQKQRIEAAKREISSAEEELAQLQASCSHAWQCLFIAIESRSDSDFLHQWRLRKGCKKCTVERNEQFFKPPCRVHLRAMKCKKTLELLSPQEGVRSRYVSVELFECTVPKCAENQTWELVGGYE